VPLSENEQRLLQQMEKALAAEDPKFASALRGRPNFTSRKSAPVAMFLAVLGVALIIGAVTIPLTALGIGGFVLVLVGILVLTSPKSEQTKTAKPAASNQPKPNFMDKFEKRWDQREQGSQD